ncbi:MAG: hypothetical protein MUE37_06200 [Bacteroidales bacterium]|jgi:photosystem II stability/assembly factor-like uncharacterized protein|nr:hypothetical protein [Bacteroidales bacterium]
MIRRTLLSAVMILITVLVAGQKTDMSLFNGIKPRNIGPAGMSGRVTAFAVDPRNENVFYVGTASGGLWKTVNAGTTFIPLFDNEAVASIGALAIDPERPDIIWAGTGEGNPRNSVTGGYGIYRSNDGGRTWKCMGLELTRYIHRIIIDPVNPDIIYAGAIGNPWAPHTERGFYRSTDGGKTWRRLLFTNETSGVADMVMDPSNPGKIFVAMWDHQRWPWFFRSSSGGSGLWLTRDGGETFERVRGGLPEEVGRIGLAIARSDPDYVYAWVESKPSAVFRSTDGGETWEKRGERNIGNRPFYYAEIYVDPLNENRVYTLFSGVNVSEDGALTFDRRTAESVHLDHHAWYIDPLNPDRMLDGNDGGIGITYDRGATWRHIENLPVGQFYHINVDNELPYNIYGGLQDNGSWRGPAYAWNNGPLINEMYDFLIGGDGFDAMPVPGDSRYCYAQSQGGSLRRLDVVTGWSKNIRPSAEDGERLRFNWNSALAQDPFDKNTIYYGSQHVHRSNDRGDSWTWISPDLTTNDPEKQKQDQSGGITIDATGAENHCTVITISPSPVKEGLIWAGTDDGMIQVTEDGGRSWRNTSQNIKGMPRNGWVPQITASAHDPGEAFAVVNDYRQGDNAAYLFRTKDYGKSWQRIIDDTDVWGYLLCFVQDPLEPELMFAGTEYGLYVSFDGGDNWNKWTSGYPTVSTYDMVIQPREHDLVIGTFGRAVWILDDIRPLRVLASKGKKLLESSLEAFEAPDAFLASTKNLPGYYFYGDAMYRGENRETGAMISFFTSADSGKISAEIKDEAGSVVKTMDISPSKGFNRFVWRLDRNPLPQVEYPSPQQQQQDQRSRFFRGFGGTVFPGTFTVTLKGSAGSSSTKVIVNPDPRMAPPDIEALRKNYERARLFGTRIESLNGSLRTLTSVRESLAKSEVLIRNNPGFAEAASETYKAVGEDLAALDALFGRRQDGVAARINGYRAVVMATGALTAQEEKGMKDAETALEEAEKQVKGFLEGSWARFSEKLKGISLPGDIVILK